MEIELDISNLREQCRTRVGEGIVCKTIGAAIQRICDEHRKRAVEEIENFIARVTVSERIMDFGLSAKIKITIPDPEVKP